MPKTPIIDKLDQLNERMQKVIMADGIVSEDERNIMEKTKISMELLKKVVTDSSIQEVNREKIQDIIAKIEDEALTAAEFDDFISEDEMGVLGVLFDSLKELRDITH